MTKSNAIDAITTDDDIKKVRTLLNERPLELLLFELGISTGLRINHLLQLKVRDISSGQTVGTSAAKITPAAKTAIQEYLRSTKTQPEELVFRKKRKDEPLSLTAISTMVKSWFKDAGITGHFSSRSLYKTWQHQSADKNSQNNKNTSRKQTHPYDLIPINTDSVYVQVQEELYKGIITGAIPAGARLSINQIAKQLNVNAVHVRLALAHLVEQGLVENGRNRSYTVKALTPEDIIEICDIRLVLEEFAFEKIRRSWSQNTAILIEKIMNQWKSSVNVVEHVHYHSSFHSLLYRDTHMPLLIDYIKNLSNRMNAFHIRVYAVDDTPENDPFTLDFKAHGNILQEIQAGNFDKAKQLLHEDIIQGKLNCMAHINLLMEVK